MIARHVKHKIFQICEHYANIYIYDFSRIIRIEIVAPWPIMLWNRDLHCVICNKLRTIDISITREDLGANLLFSPKLHVNHWKLNNLFVKKANEEMCIYSAELERLGLPQ